MAEIDRKSGRPSVRITFFGATKTVTGSKYLLEVDDRKILVDCGLFQGKKELRLKNWDEPPFNPQAISAIVLTHAHIDHTGYLPLLVRRGFRGPVFCTPATEKLLNLLLPDSAYLQEEQARYANKHQTSKHKPAKPLYTQKDAKDTLKLLRTISRDQSTEVLQGIRVTPTCAGHILGSTSLSIDLLGRRITFSGDVGRYDTPILPDPQSIDLGDLLVCESTYGDRLHNQVDISGELVRIVKQTVDKQGALLIPSFAIGRTQNLLYFLAQLEREGKIPIVPVYVDSPMAVDATKIYRAFSHDYDQQAAELIRAGETPLTTANTNLCREVRDSKRLNPLTGPRIIISASGMVTGGRILHHMKHLLPDQKTTVLFVGYQAQGTRGRRIQSGEEEVKIFGKYVPVRAAIETISGLSAHGDYSELLRWLAGCRHSPSHVRIVHGEVDSSRSFAARLKETLAWDARVAEYAETVEV